MTGNRVCIYIVIISCVVVNRLLYFTSYACTEDEAVFTFNKIAFALEHFVSWQRQTLCRSYMN